MPSRNSPRPSSGERSMVRAMRNPARSTAARCSGRRSARREGASIGYSTTVPSAWKLTQLFGKQASGFAGSGGSSATTTSTPASPSRRTSPSNSRAAARTASSAIDPRAGSGWIPPFPDSSRIAPGEPSAPRRRTGSRARARQARSPLLAGELGAGQTRDAALRLLLLHHPRDVGQELAARRRRCRP